MSPTSLMDVFFDGIRTAIAQMTWLEVFSVACGIVQVLLSRINKVSNYFFGILGILSGMYVYFDAKLYAEIALNMYYLIMSIYGWWFWMANKTAAEQPITRCNRQDWLKVIAIVLIAFAVLTIILHRVTDSDVPVWDAWVSATAWAGMWLLARRKLENWILLNISNLFAIPLYIHKDLYLFAALTTFLFIVAIFGYLKWQKIIQTQTTS